MMADERFARIGRLIGSAGLERLGRCGVTVVGLGAVGSYATEALARAGVGRLRLVDFDEVRASNINRQLYALQSTIGRRKIDIAQARVNDINPACQVQTLDCFVHVESMDLILDGAGDLLIDAIDSFTPKTELLSATRTRAIPLISSMGAALRTDPTCVRIGRLDEIHSCPLAAKVRRILRRRGVPLDFPCAYSIEPVICLPETTIDAEAQANDDTFQRGRKRRPLGSLPTLTGIFGLTIANTALRLLLGDLFPNAPRARDQT